MKDTVPVDQVVRAWRFRRRGQWFEMFFEEYVLDTGPVAQVVRAHA